jgi:hypothetical protein
MIHVITAGSVPDQGLFRYKDLGKQSAWLAWEYQDVRTKDLEAKLEIAKNALELIITENDEALKKLKEMRG